MNNDIQNFLDFLNDAVSDVIGDDMAFANGYVTVNNDMQIHLDAGADIPCPDIMNLHNIFVFKCHRSNLFERLDGYAGINQLADGRPDDFYRSM